MLQPLTTPSSAFSSADSVQPSPSRSLRKHETLYRAGDAAGHLYEVLKGSLFIYKLLDDGRRQVVDLVRPGDLCGFVDGPEHDSHCEALVAVTLVAHERCAVLSSPLLQKMLLRQIDRRVSVLHHHAIALGRKTAEERVASLLVQLVSDRSPSQCPAANVKKATTSLHMPMTRSEMADYLGLTLETVCRTLTDLERRNLIKIGQKRGEITIADTCRLCRIAKTDVCAG